MKTKGLTLKEAIESDKPFRRPEDTYYKFAPNNEVIGLTAEEILACDYELKPEAPRTEKRWKYEFRITKDHNPCDTNSYHINDFCFLTTHFPGSLKPKWFQRIEESCRLFPVL